jgi:hypothetical protein
MEDKKRKHAQSNASDSELPPSTFEAKIEHGKLTNRAYITYKHHSLMIYYKYKSGKAET